MKYYHYNSPYSAVEKQKALRLWEKSTTEFVCHRYHCSDRSLRRWKKMYDGTLESLENKKKGPRSPMPNQQTRKEKALIRRTIMAYPNKGVVEIYGILRDKYGYKRHPATLSRYLKQINIGIQSKEKSKYTPKPYNTPINIGDKMQLDVKYVPSECKDIRIPGWQNYYQYSILDEATRQRFIYPYEELSAWNTVDFVRRAIDFFGYVPKKIQTDNGIEFTYTKQTKNNREHFFDTFCRQARIIHKLIKPRTPRHNGKVERSHRNDGERFYKYLKFKNYSDLVNQMSDYLNRSNNIPISTLSSVDGKRKWLTPLQKRAELEALGYC